MCLPSDAFWQHLLSYLGFSYLGRGVSLHSCSSKAQPRLLALDEGFLLTAAPPDLECGEAPLSPPVPTQPPLLDMEQQTGSKQEKEYVKAIYCHPAYLTYMQRNAGLEEAQAGIKIAGRNINNFRYADDTTLMAQSEEELKSLLMKVKEAFEFLFTFCHKGGVNCISEVIDISPGNLDSSLCFLQPSVSLHIS